MSDKNPADTNFKIDVDGIKDLIRMTSAEKLEFIEWASMFGLIPASEWQSINKFVARLRAAIIDKNDNVQNIIIQGGIDGLHLYVVGGEKFFRK
jgi:hypothetical protein